MQNWIPNFRSWLSAIFLILVMAGLQTIAPYLWLIVSWLISLLPRLEGVVIALALLSPIAMLAVLHHWLHRILDQYFPQATAEVTRAAGVFPGLLSWWEGLYGWLVNYLALLISSAILSFVFPRENFHVSEDVTAWMAAVMQPQPEMVVMIALRIVVAALFYQFEFAVQQQLLSARR